MRSAYHAREREDLNVNNRPLGNAEMAAAAAAANTQNIWSKIDNLPYQTYINTFFFIE